MKIYMNNVFKIKAVYRGDDDVVEKVFGPYSGLEVKGSQIFVLDKSGNTEYFAFWNSYYALWFVSSDFKGHRKWTEFSIFAENKKTSFMLHPAVSCLFVEEGFTY